MYVELIGIAAAILTTASFVPQVYKIWKHKNTQGLSVIMYLVMLFGVILWEIYGILIQSFAVILANIITALLLLLILYFRFKYKQP